MARVRTMRDLLRQSKRMPNGCIEWQGPRNQKGYGQVTSDHGRSAHRVAWTLVRGPVGASIHVLHSCDNPPCVNVDHLRLGSNADNVRDKVKRNRTRKGARHPMTRLSEEDVVRIRKLAAGGATYASLGRRFGLHRSNIKRICDGESWDHLPDPKEGR